MEEFEYKVTIMIEGAGENEIKKMEFYLMANNFEEAVERAKYELGI